MEDKEIMVPQVDVLFEKITALIDDARKRVKTAVNLSMVYTYYGIGQYIVEDEQQGKYRAAYGKRVLETLSARLTHKYGDGWSVETLKKARQFYQTYSVEIGSTVSTQFPGQTNSGEDSVHSVDRISETGVKTPAFVLDWSHYLILMRIKDRDARRFYEIESLNGNWNVRQLQRQVSSSLYERIA